MSLKQIHRRLLTIVGLGFIFGPAVRGGALGVYRSSVSLAIIISTAIAGLIFAVSPSTPYWVGALLSIVALLPALLLPFHLRQQKAVIRQQQSAVSGP